MAITDEEIIAACEQIEEKGQEPTQQAVRALTGGSYSTIGPVLKSWKERREEDARLRDVPVPDAIADASSIMIAKNWEEALKHATAGQDAMRKALLEAQAAADAARAEAAVIIAELEAEGDKLRGSLKSALGRLETLEQERQSVFWRMHG